MGERHKHKRRIVAEIIQCMDADRDRDGQSDNAGHVTIPFCQVLAQGMSIPDICHEPHEHIRVNFFWLV